MHDNRELQAANEIQLRLLLRCSPTQRRHVRELRAVLEVQRQLREILQAAQSRERRHVRELPATREVQRQLREVLQATQRRKRRHVRELDAVLEFQRQLRDIFCRRPSSASADTSESC